jgi:hypothetical protein
MAEFQSPLGDVTVEVPDESAHSNYLANGWVLAGADETPEPKRRGRPPKTEDK